MTIVLTWQYIRDTELNMHVLATKKKMTMTLIPLELQPTPNTSRRKLKPLIHRGQTQEPSEEWTAKMNVHCLPLLISVLYTFIYMCISLFRKQSFENMRYLEGHGFNSRWGLRKSFFSVFRLENASSLFTLYPSHQSIYHLFTFIISTCWALQCGRTHVTI